MTDTAELHLAAENRELRNTVEAQSECIKANAEERQDWQRELLAAKSDFSALRKALQSIAGSRCCDGCQEASRVAAAALAARPGGEK